MTGAVVVVALAVIFVPMLFEEEVSVPPMVESPLPTEPDFASRFEPATLSPPVESARGTADADLPVMDGDLSAVESEPPETDDLAFAPPLVAPGQISQPDRTRRIDSAPQPDRLNQSSAKPAATPTKPAATPTKPAATPTKPAATKPVTPTRPVVTTKPAIPAKPAATPPAKTATPAKPEKTAPNARSPADGMPTWVVQVASLGSAQAADDLEKKLRGDGFSAFVEKAEVRGKTYYRVRVGPNADRTSAEQTADRLRQKQKVEPLVQRYQQ